MEQDRRDTNHTSAALVVPTDVADAAAMFAGSDHAEAQWGRIDPWVNDVMETVVGPVGLMDRILARTACEAQLSSDPAPPGDPGMLAGPADPVLVRAGLAPADVAITAAAFPFGQRRAVIRGFHEHAACRRSLARRSCP